FCTSRYYRPLPDVYIEHGNQYDFWNHISDLWDKTGQAGAKADQSAVGGIGTSNRPLRTDEPSTIRLPFGSQYVLRVGHPIDLAYPFFDHFEPSINILRQVALLSLLDPDLTIKTAERLMEMLSYSRLALANLSPDEERIPVRLFEHALLDFLAFQQDVEARSPEWKAIEANTPTVILSAAKDLSPERAQILRCAQDDNLDNSHTQGTASKEAQENAMMEFLALQNALMLPPAEAIAAICTPAVYSM